MQAERSIDRTGWLAPLAQAGLAALVAGSLLTFSTLAFRTAFDRPVGTDGIAVSVPRTAPSAPVVLATRPEPNAPAASAAAPEVELPPETVVVSDTTVLGTRTDRTARAKHEPRDRSKEDHERFTRADHRKSLAGYSWSESEDSHEHAHGKGHEKTRGRGHTKDGDDHGSGHGRPDHARSELGRPDHARSENKGSKGSEDREDREDREED